jgi:hypothetical protein
MILFLFLAILGFTASVIVHGSTFVGRLPLGMNRAWPLHIGIFLVFVPALLLQRRVAGGKRKGSWREQFAHAPRWMMRLLSGLFLYTLVNFAAGMVMTGAFSGESITTRDGKHVVVRQRQVVRPVDDAEYQQYQERELRLFSGHWMLFYWAAAVMITDGLLRRRGEAPAALPQGQS